MVTLLVCLGRLPWLVLELELVLRVPGPTLLARGLVLLLGALGRRPWDWACSTLPMGRARAMLRARLAHS